MTTPQTNPLRGTDWARLLEAEFTTSDWTRLLAFLEEQYASLPGGVFPPQKHVFRALEVTWCEQTKVVILGQDPYQGAGRAGGLCFSVGCGAPIPDSLRNVFTELSADLDLPMPQHGNLLPWAHRGVLLLNTALTVGGNPRSHGRMWRAFIEAVIRVVARTEPVFLLWGGKAQEKEQLITEVSDRPPKIIKSSHPSPLAAHKSCGDSPPFIDSKPFSKTNELLRRSGWVGIDWNLDPCPLHP